MSAKFSQPYQSLLLRILHGLTGLLAIAAMITAFWTYDTYDGRWGGISLPKFTEIESVHGTFGLWTLLIFPLFLLITIALHLLMSIKVGGMPLILSMINGQFRSKDSPALWRKHFSNWREYFNIAMLKQWLFPFSLHKVLEVFVLTIIVLAWLISLVKEIS